MTNRKNREKHDRQWKNVRGNASSRIDPATLVYGKIPPQDQELETAVLGALLLEKNAFDLVGDFLKPETFYHAHHQKIFQVISELHQLSIPVDLLTVAQQLRKNGELEMIGGPFYLSKITKDVVSAANIEAHARIIHQKWMQRELIRISGEIITQAYEDTTDVFDLLDSAENGLFAISTGHLRSDFSSAEVLYRTETKELEHRMHRKEEVTGVPTGFRTLDKLTCGWQPTDLIIFPARPSVGKTAFALNLARNAALHETKPTGVGIFSLEMSKSQVMQRLISMQSGIELRKIRRGRLDAAQLLQLHSECRTTIANAPIFVDDTPALNIFELRAKARRMVNNHGVGLIIIDYLQLMSGVSNESFGNREQEISRISRSLKNLAKELHVPVIALSQMSREIEKRKDGRPQMSDIRESGAIEQDADLVAFIVRMDYQKEAHEVDPSLQGSTEIIFKKHRNGELDTIALNADLSRQLFTDIDVFADQMNVGASMLIPMRDAEMKFAKPQPGPADDSGDELPF